MSTPVSARPSWQTPAVIISCGCLIAIISFGIRSSLGLFTDPLSTTYGWSREIFAFAIAIQNLIWGAGQPFAGALADRFGSVRVLAGGGILYTLGVALMAFSDTPSTLTLTAGVLIGLGLSGSSFTIVLAAFSRLVPEEKRAWAFGIGTAAGSMGQFLFAPLGQAFISGYGWQTALLLLAVFTLTVPLLANALRGGNSQSLTGETSLPLGKALRVAFGHGSYRLLVTGFFVCGFHLAFITTHLPPYLTDLGLNPGLAAWSIALIGLFNIIGAYASGMLAGRFSKSYLLSAIYFSRAVAIALFVLTPVTQTSVLLFGAAMGLLWLSIVPPTSGLVAVMFGTRYMATLFGIVFFSHQVGAFIGVWLGGVLYERTGSYDIVWWLGVALGIAAAIVHLPIAERRVDRFFAPAT